MRRALAAVLALAALGASVLPFESEARDRRCRRTRNGARTDDCVSYAFFEAFPASGAGTTSACDTTAPTGAKGEALTFTRASAAYCTKTASGGLATTGIADGDLVSLSNNVARVEYDGAGVLGLRVENARTNATLQSQSFDSPTWSKTASGVAIPTVTANAATAPDGTTTAERVQIPATTTTQYSFVSQGSACPATSTGSIYIRGNGTSGTIEMWFGSPGACLSCAYVSGSWTRCAKSGNAAGFFVIGNDGTNCGSGTRSAQDVFIWQAQCETAGYATSPILTTTATAQRLAETPSFAAITGNEVVSAGSAAANAYVPWTGASGTGGLLWESATGRYLHFNGTTVRTFDGTNEPSVAHSLTAGTNKRFASAWSGATFSVFNVSDGTSNTLAFDGSMTAGTALFVGYSSSNGWIDGVISRVCLDTDPARCR